MAYKTSFYGHVENRTDSINGMPLRQKEQLHTSDRRHEPAKGSHNKHNILPPELAADTLKQLKEVNTRLPLEEVDNRMSKWRSNN